MVLLGLALGQSGPYGTYESIPLLPRLGFWLAVIFAPWALWQMLYAAARAMAPPDTSWLVLTAGLMLPFSIVGSLLTQLIGMAAFGSSLTNVLQGWPVNIGYWLMFSLGLLLPMQWIGATLAQDYRKTGGQRVADFLMNKLPARLRSGELIALKAEDHYLRVYTTKGDDLIHMSLSDALTSLEGFPGIQTHRSWWLSLSTPTGLEPTKSWAEVKTQGDLRIPISRRRKRAVQAALSKASGTPT